MANKTIGQLTAKTTPSSADVFALEDTEDTKKINYDALADAILNKITSKQYTVAGQSQTLINAINVLNSNTLPLYKPRQDVTDANAFLTSGTARVSHNTTSNLPENGYYVLQVIVFSSGTDVIQYAYNVNNTLVWHRSFHDGTTWTDWELVPRRSEINALNSRLKFSRINSGTINDITAYPQGVYMQYVAGTVTGAPLASSSLIITFVFAEWIAFQISAIDGNVFMYRFCGSSGWSTWKRISLT